MRHLFKNNYHNDVLFTDVTHFVKDVIRDHVLLANKWHFAKYIIIMSC